MHSLSLWFCGLFPPHGAFDIALRIALLHRVAFIVLLFPATDAEQHFRSTFLEVHFERHEREAFFKGLAGEFVDFAG